jgi:hypothetical protein
MAEATLDEVMKKIEDKYGVAVATAVSIYMPPIKRLDVGSLLDFAAGIQDPVLATDELRKHMTGEELADEKTKLAALITAMSDKNAAKWRAANQLTQRAIQLALGALIGAL